MPFPTGAARCMCPGAAVTLAAHASALPLATSGYTLHSLYSLHLCALCVGWRGPVLLERGREREQGRESARADKQNKQGGITEAKARNTSPEKDDDWIKISQYVSNLNPNILQDATSALTRQQWRGEGVQQPGINSQLPIYLCLLL